MIVGYKRVSSVEQKFDRQDLGEVDKLLYDQKTGRLIVYENSFGDL